MNHKPFAATVACLTLIACANPVAPPAEDLSASSSSEAELKGPQKVKRPRAPSTWEAQVSDTATHPVFASTFTILETYDLYFAFDVPSSLPGTHNAAFEIVAPDGSVYQRTDVTFTTGASPHTRVWSSMPVVGTWIQQFSMSGDWQVRVFLDAEQVSRASKTFVLQ